MRRVHLFFILSATLTLPTVAQNILKENIKKNYYVGISTQYNRIYGDNDKSFLGETNSQDITGGITAIFGYKNFFESQISNKNFSLNVEGRVSKNFLKKDYSDSLNYSVFLKPNYKFEKNIEIYGLFGFGAVIIKGENGKIPVETSLIGKNILNTTAFQWGLGANYPWNKRITLFLDYTSLASEKTINSRLYNHNTQVSKTLSMDAINLGFTYSF